MEDKAEQAKVTKVGGIAVHELARKNVEARLRFIARARDLEPEFFVHFYLRGAGFACTHFPWSKSEKFLVHRSNLLTASGKPDARKIKTVASAAFAFLINNEKEAGNE